MPPGVFRPGKVGTVAAPIVHRPHPVARRHRDRPVAGVIVIDRSLATHLQDLGPIVIIVVIDDHPAASSTARTASPAPSADCHLLPADSHVLRGRGWKEPVEHRRRCTTFRGVLRGHAWAEAVSVYQGGILSPELAQKAHAGQKFLNANT